MHACDPPSKSSFLSQRPFAIPKASSHSILQDLISRFQSLKSLSSKITTWYSQAWQDVSEELTVLAATETPSAAPPLAKYEDLSREFQIKGSLFEGLFAAMKRAVTDAESLIRNYCFKRRGKYSETECKKGVGMALERMANEIWRQVAMHVQKPVNVRASEAMKSLASVQRDTGLMVTKLKEAQDHFEEVLNRHLLALPKDQIWPCSSSEAQIDEKYSPFSIDLYEEMREQSSKLMRKFEKYAKTATPKGANLSINKEMGGVLRDMALMARASTGETGKDERNKLSRQLMRMRNRVEGVCRALEDSTGKQTPLVDPQDYEKLKELVGKQAEEIEKLRKNMRISSEMLENSYLQSSVELDKHALDYYRSSTPDAPRTPPDLPAHRLVSEHLSYQLSPAESISYREDLERLNQTQVSLLSHLQSLQNTLQKVTISPLPSSIPSLSTDFKEDYGLGLMLKAMPADSQHQNTENNAELLRKFASEMLDLKQKTGKLIAAAQEVGWKVSDLTEIEEEMRKQARIHLELSEKHDELLLKVIKIQSEAELDTNYHKNRISELEKQLEIAQNAKKSEEIDAKTAISPLKGLQGLLAALPKLAVKQGSAAHRPTDSRINFFEEEIAHLSAENFAFVSKLESAREVRYQLLDKIDHLEREMHQYKRQIEAFRALNPLSEQHFQSYEARKRPHIDDAKKSSFESAPGGTEELFLPTAAEGADGSHLKRVSILEGWEGKAERS